MSSPDDIAPWDADANVLYVLELDPLAACDQIESAVERSCARPVRSAEGTRRLLDLVEELLRDQAVEPPVTARIGTIYAHSDTPRAIRGPLGLYLTLSAIQEASLQPMHNPDLEEAANYWLQDEAVIFCLYLFYGLPPAKVDLRTTTLHRVGTTSLILQTTTAEGDPYRLASEYTAVKCLLPRYFGVRAIREQTRDYAKTYKPLHRHHRFVPNIGDSDETWIVMAFVEGPTLADSMLSYVPLVSSTDKPADIARKRALTTDDLEFIREVFTALCDVLSALRSDPHASRRHHLDLSPFNVIVSSNVGDALQISLIDFGRNIPATEHVGATHAISRASLYVAPELLDAPETDDWHCDAYSLGVILLEMAARRPLAKEDLHHELDRLWQGEEPWPGALGLARIVEELIDRRPQNRLLLASHFNGTGIPRPDGAGGSDPYIYLKKLVRQEVEVQELYEARSRGKDGHPTGQDGGDGFGLLKGQALFNLDLTRQIGNLRKAGTVRQDSVDDTYADYPELGVWAGIAVAAWILALGAVIYLTAADLHILSLQSTLSWVVRHVHPPFVRYETHHGHLIVFFDKFWRNLPGRLEALSFALVSVTYYVNIYSVLSPKRIATRLGWLSEIVLRSSTFLLPIPVMWAILWDPHAWALCSGFGTLLVVVNNFLTVRIAREACSAAATTGFSTLSVTPIDFIEKIYGEWWTLMLFYSLSLVAIGFLLDARLAIGQGVFAFLAIFINLGKIYRLNCTRLAPQVRGWLSWSILTLRRAQRASTVVASAADVPSPTVAAITEAWRRATVGRP